jgi:hypothetical protein
VHMAARPFNDTIVVLKGVASTVAGARIYARKPKREGRAGLLIRGNSDLAAMGFDNQSSDIKSKPEMGPMLCGDFDLLAAHPRLKDDLLAFRRNRRAEVVHGDDDLGRAPSL